MEVWVTLIGSLREILRCVFIVDHLDTLSGSI